MGEETCRKSHVVWYFHTEFWLCSNSLHAWPLVMVKEMTNNWNKPEMRWSQTACSTCICDGWLYAEMNIEEQTFGLEQASRTLFISLVIIFHALLWPWESRQGWKKNNINVYTTRSHAASCIKMTRIQGYLFANGIKKKKCAVDFVMVAFESIKTNSTQQLQ